MLTARGRYAGARALDLEDGCKAAARSLHVRGLAAVHAGGLSRDSASKAVETMSLVGYYTMISMILNTARTPLPADAKPALAPFPY